MRQTKSMMTSILFIALLLVSACGTNTTAPAKDKAVVKIGVTFPLTGDAAFLGESAKNSVELALKEAGNTKYSYELVFEDDKLDPKIASTTVNKLISVDNVDALVSFSSGIGNVASPIAQDNKVVHVGIGSDSNIAKGEYNFLHWTPPDEEARSWVKEAQARGYKNIAVLTVQQQGEIAIVDSVDKYIQGTGMKIVSKQVIAPGEKDFKTYLLKAEESKQDLYLLLLFDPELPILFKQMKEMNIQTQVTSIEAFELVNDPSLFEGLWYVNAADAKASFHDHYKADYGNDPQLGSANAYDATKLIIECFERAGKDPAVKPSNEAVVQALYKVKDFDGALGKLSVGEDGIVWSPASVRMIKDGKPVTITATDEKPVFTGAATATATDKTPIKIGASLPLTGEAASFGLGAKAGIDTAVSEINAKGGIDGRQIQIIYEDDKCTPKEGASVYSKLSDVDNVDAIVGPICSSVAGAGLAVSQQAGVPSVIIGASAPALTKIGNFIFRVYPSDSFAGRYAAKYMAESFHAKRIAVVYVQNDYGQGLADEFAKTLDSLGGELVAKEGVAQDSTDLKTVIAKIQAAKPDAIYIALYPATALVFLKQVKEAGVQVPILGTDALLTDEVTASDVAQGIPLIIAKVSEPESFKETVTKTTGATNLNFCTPLGYDSIMVLANAMEQAGTDKQAVRDALAKVSYKAVSTPIIEFDTNGDLKTVVYDVKLIANKTSVVIG